MPAEIVNSGNSYFSFDREEGVLIPVTREQVEGWRGITREKGFINRKDSWKYERIDILLEKHKDFSIKIDNIKKEIWSLEEELNLPYTDIQSPVIEKTEYINVEKEVIKTIYVPKEVVKEVIKEINVPGKPIVQEVIREVYIYVTFWDKIKEFFRGIF